MTTIQDAPRYASPVDFEVYGEYGPGRGFERGQSFQRPRYRFQGRITADGSSGYQAEPGRYHLYISWGCPWAQRTAIVRKLMGLEDVVSLSYVDDVRDGRGWAFRERRGPDPVNGFRFLAEAYEATEPGYDGHVSVPALWDRQTSRLAHDVLGAAPEALFPAWALTQRQQLEAAGIAPPTIELADTDLAAIRWADQPGIDWVLLIPSLAAAHTQTVFRPVAPRQLVPFTLQWNPSRVHTIAVARFVHCALAADLPPGWHTQPDHLHHTEPDEDPDGPPPQPATRLGCDPGSCATA